MPTLRNASECDAAARRGTEWVLSQRLPEGAFRSETAEDGKERRLRAYDKAPVLFCRSGHGEVAARCLHWLSQNLMVVPGCFRDDETDSVDDALLRDVEMNSWICRGAHICGRYDLSSAGGEHVASCQGKDVGGVYNRRQNGARCATHGVESAASAGSLFLFLGKTRLARRAGSFLIRALEKQPQPKKFFVRFDGEANPVTEFPEALAALYRVDSSLPGQRYGALGMPAVLLANLAQATGESDFLKGAKEYFRLAEGCAPDVLETLASANVGWAAAALYGITRQRRYYEATEKVAGTLVAAQDAEGRWWDSSVSDTVEEQPQADTLSLTAEISVLLFEYLRLIQ